MEKNQAFEQEIRAQEQAEPNSIVQELGDKVKKVQLKDDYAAVAQNLRLPQFYLDVPSMGLFGSNEPVLLNQEALLSNFRLADGDIKIDWDSVDSELYSVDLEHTSGNQYQPVYL
ncbi:MAG: hypothetical protein LH609_04715 [Rudanella sp.]|nr:hypothetical protein [Rudanella sp.]